MMRGNGFKQKEGRFRLDIRNKLLTVRVVSYWNRLLEGSVLAYSSGLELDDLKCPFQPKPFCGSVIKWYDLECFYICNIWPCQMFRHIHVSKRVLECLPKCRDRFCPCLKCNGYHRSPLVLP